MDFDCLEELLALPEFRVLSQVMNPKQLEVHLERRATFLVCPRCQRCCSRVQDSRPRCLRDFPILEHPVVLWLHLRRFACVECHHRPWEKRETFGAPVKWTERRSTQVRQEYLPGGPCRALARRYGLSERPVCRWTFERRRGGRPRTLGRALGSDEYARRQGHRSNPLLVDLDRGTPIAPVKGRRAEEVIAWFKSRPQAERDQVEGVVVERSKTYASAIQELCGEQGQVIDRFPVVQRAVEALDGVVRSGPTQRDPEEAKALKKLRKRWLKSATQLAVDELIARDEWRRRFPELRAVIDWVQNVRTWCERKSEKPAREALLQLIERASHSALAGLQRLSGTLSRWFEPIVRSRRHRYRNGMTEGFNNKIKVSQRMASGRRNEHNRQKRILAWCGKT
jgi:transposase